ncbi:MAG: SGNH/GDSL hydrolase family protein [Kiritimatiellia bacterium]
MFISSGAGRMSGMLLKYAGLASALAAGVALADVDVPEVITDVSGYVQLTAAGHNLAGAFAGSGTYWSDGAAPSGDKDYIVQKNRILRITSGGTFAGRSLTLDNGRIKTAAAGSSSAYTLTFDDLRIYGGRLEQSVGSSTRTLAGTVHVRGTADNPSRFSGSSGRTFRIDSTLEGDETGVAKVMMTEEDGGGMNSSFFQCWFTADSAASYKGCFRVEGATTNWGHRIALCATNLVNLGAGDPSAATSVVTLKDRAAFLGAYGMAFDNPAYSIAIENGGTIGGYHASGASGIGVTFDGGVTIRGTKAAETLTILGDQGAVALNDVKLENLSALTLESGTLWLGQDFTCSDTTIAVAEGASLGGTGTGGQVVLDPESICMPGDAPGARGTLTFASASVTGLATLQVDLAREDGTLLADHLIVNGKLLKGSEVSGLVVSFQSFPDGVDWEGRVRLISATNLGEEDGFGVSDIKVTGFPSVWTSTRNSGQLVIEADEDGVTKHLVWEATIEETPTVRIMPLGDSITYGSRSSGSGYRQPLYDLLVNAGYKPDFVGTLQTAEGEAATDPDHEGHRGWVIARDGNPDRDGGDDQDNDYDGLYEHVEEWLEKVETPHVILLHIGTNDLFGDDFAHAKDRLGLLIDRLLELCPKTWIVVTTLLNRNDSESYNAAIATQFNPFVAEIVRSRRVLGCNVAYLDMNAAVSQENLSDDGIHPNDSGYDQMAAAWFGAIQAIMPSAVALPVLGQDCMVKLTGVNQSQTTSWDTALQWNSGASPQAGYYYFVPTNTLLRTPEKTVPEPFAGESLIINGGNVNLKHPYNSTATANWVLYGGSRLAHGNGGGIKDGEGNVIQRPFVMGLGGTLDVRGTAEAPARLTGSAAGGESNNITGDRTLKVTASLIGAEDAVLAMARTEGESDASGCAFVCYFSGDNTAYRGRFTASAAGATPGRAWEFGFDSTASLGAPVADGAKVTLDDGMKLVVNGVAFTNGYDLALAGNATISTTGSRPLSGRYADTQYANEGFYFGEGVQVRGSGESVLVVDGSAVPALGNVSFSGVAQIETTGIGLRVYPDYNQPELPFVVRGFLASGSENVGPVTLEENGAIQPGVGTSGGNCIGRMGVASLAFEAGSSLRFSVARFGDDISNDFVRVTDAIDKRTPSPIEICFDCYPYDLPAGTRIPLLSAANLGTDLQPTDFRVSCLDESLNAWIEGSFTIETIDGAPTLVFAQSSLPIVKLAGSDASGNDSWATGLHWSNAQAPSAAFDYFLPAGTLLRRSTSGDAARFAGHSLVICRGGDFAINGQTAQIDDLRLLSGGILTTRNDGTANRLTGLATVFAARGTPFEFEIESGGGSRTLNLEATFRGSGDLRFRYYHSSYAASGSDPKTYYLVKGDNSAFTGGIELHQRAVCVEFQNECAMGGPAPAFRADRLLFTSNATLRCRESYVMADSTRGITVGLGGTAAFAGGTIEVLAGQTLTVSNLIAGVSESILRKTGSGTLVLACATNTFSGRLRHQAGVLAIGAAGAVANASLQSLATSVWRVDAPEGMTVASLDAVVAHESDGNQTLLVRPAAFASPHTDGTFTVNLVRFKGATAADAETALARVSLDDSELERGWMCELAAEEVEDGLLVTATMRRRAMTIIIR